MEQQILIEEQDNSTNSGGAKSYQNEMIYREPDDDLEKTDLLCRYMESRLI